MLPLLYLFGSCRLQCLRISSQHFAKYYRIRRECLIIKCKRLLFRVIGCLQLIPNRIFCIKSNFYSASIFTDKIFFNNYGCLFIACNSYTISIHKVKIIRARYFYRIIILSLQFIIRTFVHNFSFAIFVAYIQETRVKHIYISLFKRKGQLVCCTLRFHYPKAITGTKLQTNILIFCDISTRSHQRIYRIISIDAKLKLSRFF